MRKLLAHAMLALIWNAEVLIVVMILSQVVPAIVEEQPSGGYTDLEWWMWAAVVLITTTFFYVLHAMAEPLRIRCRALLYERLTNEQR